jgi:hypothetical protein
LVSTAIFLNCRSEVFLGLGDEVLQDKHTRSDLEAAKWEKENVLRLAHCAMIALLSWDSLSLQALGKHIENVDNLFGAIVP